MDNILELELVSKTFPKSNYTLDKVSFSIPYGAIMGLIPIYEKKLALSMTEKISPDI